jgi:competence protein ComEC
MPIVLAHTNSTLIPPKTGWQMHVLDVGQGKAVLITTEKGAMLIDTGASFGTSSYAQQIILPFIAAQRSLNLELFVVSHDDDDHAGGAAHVMQRYPNALNLTSSECRRGHYFHWRGLDVSVLWPTEQFVTRYPNSDNNHSCVIHISDGEHAVLLAGDIEKEAETELLKLEHQRLEKTGKSPLFDVAVLLAPHHGSRTSSSWSFVGATQPDHVVFTTGVANRWGFPATSVVDRYRLFDAQIWDTAKQGYLLFELGEDAPRLRVSSWREDISPRWYRQIN